jgi:AraC-like DNA-binding protein
MSEIPSRSGGEGLERSCGEQSSDWVRSTDVVGGVELLEAWFQGPAYHKHRHDTYAISLTQTGVQAFAYRGATHASLPGMVVVLHPDETHDGYAGADGGFGYRQVYVEPASIFEAVRQRGGRACSLPFLRDPVVSNMKLAIAIQSAFQDDREPLAIDDLVVQLADGMIDADPRCTRAPIPRHLDVAAVDRARQFLDAEKTRVVRSWELEDETGLTRFDLARQFRAILGTSPYRYLLMRRLAFARTQMSRPHSLADIALAAGFADQAHFTRAFTAAFGISPARYAALSAATPG